MTSSPTRNTARSVWPSLSMSSGYAPVTAVKVGDGRRERREAQRSARRALVVVQRRRLAAAGEVQLAAPVVVAVERRHAAADEVLEVTGVAVIDAAGLGHEARRAERRGFVRRTAAPGGHADRQHRPRCAEPTRTHGLNHTRRCTIRGSGTRGTTTGGHADVAPVLRARSPRSPSWRRRPPELLVGRRAGVRRRRLHAGRTSTVGRWPGCGTRPLLELIRQVVPAPTVHARNLFHTSAAMWDAWAAYDAGRRRLHRHREGGGRRRRPQAREAAISYAAYRLLLWRYGTVV